MTDPVDFIPAGCCCDTKPWLGRRASTAPLPESFIRAAVAQGAIVPPPSGVRETNWLAVALAFGVLAVCGALAVVYGTRV